MVYVYVGTIDAYVPHVYVMQALVRIQANMLADILVAIPAVDLAIEAVV